MYVPPFPSTLILWIWGWRVVVLGDHPRLCYPLENPEGRSMAPFWVVLLRKWSIQHPIFSSRTSLQIKDRIEIPCHVTATLDLKPFISIKSEFL